MGSAEGVADELPVRRVRLSAFGMSEHLVTAGQYEAFCKATGTPMPSAPGFNPKWIHKDHPISGLRWQDARAYAVWAGGDLPTEAQWEYAARGGAEGRTYHWGDAWDGKRLNHSVGAKSGGTVPVTSYPPNGYGLYDMAGNVWQWCRDWYRFEYLADDTLDPTGPEEGAERVLRGGAWYLEYPDTYRCAVRYNYDPEFWSFYFGLRVAFSGLE